MNKFVDKWRRAVSGCVSKYDRTCLIDNDYLEPVVHDKKDNDAKSKTSNSETKVPIYADYDLSYSMSEYVAVKSTEKNKPKKEKKKKLEKQVSADSNYFSDPEMHHYEDYIEEENEDLCDNDFLINRHKNCSKNNLFTEANCESNSILMRGTETGLKIEQEKKQRSNFIETKYDRLRRTIWMNKENVPESAYEIFSQQMRIDATVSDSASSMKNQALATSAQQPPSPHEYIEYRKRINPNVYAKLNFEEADNKKDDNEDKQPKSSLKRRILNFDQKIINSGRHMISSASEFTQIMKAKANNLTELKPLSEFESQNDGVLWYFNLLRETMSSLVNQTKEMSDDDKQRRLNMISAHHLYAKNFYEMRSASSKNLRNFLVNMHPCVIALACLLDSDAIRIVESHCCVYDCYVYLFSTRIRFCCWKAKYYIILKKPKRSSIGRLNLIEELINCFKLLQDKSM